jgi:hypothetical protein
VGLGFLKNSKEDEAGKIRSTRRRVPSAGIQFSHPTGGVGGGGGGERQEIRRLLTRQTDASISIPALRYDLTGFSSHFNIFLIHFNISSFFINIFYEKFDLIASPPGGTSGQLVADERHLALVHLFEEATGRAGSRNNVRCAAIKVVYCVMIVDVEEPCYKNSFGRMSSR